MTYNYVSFDCETSGLDPLQDQILEVGVVADDFKYRVPPAELEDYLSQLPVFHCYVRHERYSGDAYALALNTNILSQISRAKDIWAQDGTQVLEAHQVMPAILRFLSNHGVADSRGKITAAGKNFGSLDSPFLKNLPGDYYPFSHKVIDPGMLYFNPLEDDEVPGLPQCLERAGYAKEVAHTAVEDALDVIRVLRHKWDCVYEN